MDKFRKLLKRRLLLLGGCAAGYIVANIGLYLFAGVKGNENASSFIQGFQFGVGLFIFGILIYFAARYTSAMCAEGKLKELYIFEHDERRIAIRVRAGSTGMKSAIFGLAGAAVLAGYLDATVFFTLLCASLFVALIHAALKLYYRNKY